MRPHISRNLTFANERRDSFIGLSSELAHHFPRNLAGLRVASVTSRSFDLASVRQLLSQPPRVVHYTPIHTPSARSTRRSLRQQRWRRLSRKPVPNAISRITSARPRCGRTTVAARMVTRTGPGEVGSTAGQVSELVITSVWLASMLMALYFVIFNRSRRITDEYHSRRSRGRTSGQD